MGGRPADEYARRLDVARRRLGRLARLERGLRAAQAGVIAAGVVLLAARPLWALACAPALAGLLACQWVGRRAAARAARGAEFYERGLARLDGRWAGTGDGGTRFSRPDHPYAVDLDLFGAGSSFERLSTAGTEAGAALLARWLLGPADADELRDRHEAVRDLRDRLDLRESLWVECGRIPEGADPDHLARWAAAPPELPPGWVAAAGYGVLFVATLTAAHQWGGDPRAYVAAFVGTNLVFWLTFRKRVDRAAAPLRRRAGELKTFRSVLRAIEREPFDSPALARLRDSLGRSPSRAVAELASQAGRLWLMDSLPEFRWIGWSEMRTTRVAFAAEGWRRRHGRDVARWLAAVARFEALASLAAYAAENPDDPFPELAGPDAPFEAEGVSHPLLPPGRSVANDLALGGERRGLIVTGSNMSGKSTLLRAVGTNAVLALAGAPVRARRLRLAPLAVGASIAVRDSLADGESRFLAEVRRLRQLFDLAGGPLPLLFLIDEVLGGTNPVDRRRGAEAVIVGLLELGAVGLMTTHDLPLTELAERPGLGLANVHLADSLDRGRLHFDYKLRPGVVRGSSALAIMRQAGLPVVGG